MYDVFFSHILGRYAEGWLKAAGDTGRDDTGSENIEDGGPLVPQARCAISDQ